VSGALDSLSSCRKHNPLKKELSHLDHCSSTPRDSKADSHYKKMVFDSCEKFVGPMPVEDFLSEFVPSNTKESRPTVKIPFGPRTVSENENEFASIPKLIDDCHHLMLFTD